MNWRLFNWPSKSKARRQNTGPESAVPRSAQSRARALQGTRPGDSAAKLKRQSRIPRMPRPSQGTR